MVFIVLLPLAGLLFLRFGPVWGASAAAYFYYAIPSREFYAPALPYQAGFFFFAVVTSFRIRREGFRKATEELIAVAIAAAEGALGKVRGPMTEVLVRQAIEPDVTVDLEARVVASAEAEVERHLHETAPVALVLPVKAVVLEVIRRGAEAGAKEARDTQAVDTTRTRGDLRVAIEQRAVPAMHDEIDRLLRPRVRETVLERVAEHEKRRDPRKARPTDGPLDYPMFRGPFLGIVTNAGLWLHVVFIVITYIGAQFAEYSYWGAMGRFETSYLLLIPLLGIVASVRDPDHFRIFTYAWLLGVLHLSYNAVTLWLTQGGGRADRIGGQGGEANFYGAICVTVAPVLFSMILTEPKKLFRLAALGASPWAALGIIACGSRGALIAMVGAMGYWIIQTRKKALALGLGMIAIAGFLAVAPESFWERMGTIVGKKDDNPWVRHSVENSAASRIVLWNLALDIYKENPWFGVGPHQYVNISAERTTLTDAYQGQRGMMTHSTWLQMLAEYGTLGTLVWGGNFFLAAYFYRRARKILSPYRRWDWYGGMCLGLEAGVLANAAAQMFSSFQWYDYSYWMMIYGPLSAQIAKEIARREEWLVPGGATTAPPEARYGPPKKASLELDIDLRGTPVVAGPRT